jgi:hypothetical protein
VNDDLLVEELLQLQQMNYDLDLTGFPADELMRLLEPNGPRVLAALQTGIGDLG